MSSLQVAKILKTPISVHWTLPLYVALLLFQVGLAKGLPLAAVIFGSVLLHEFGHILMAQARKIPTAGINLNMFGGVASIRLDRKTTGLDEFLVAIAGPVVSAFLAAVGFLLTPYVGHGLVLTFTTYLTLVNFIMVVFNLLPAFPLDGGRVLRGLLRLKLDFTVATKIATYISYVVLSGAAVFAVIHQAWVVLVLLGFLALGATLENKAAA